MKRFLATSGAALSLLAVLTFGVFGSHALARDGHKGNKNKTYIVGTVESIDMQKKTFTVVNSDGMKTVVAVTPDTEFEVERGKGNLGDFFAKFSDLRVNDWVKAKSYQTLNAGPLAREVEIYRQP